MELDKAIQHPDVNVFDIIPYGKGYTVYTHFKPDETKEEFNIRHQKNLLTAQNIKKTKPAC